ncbi:MAG: TRAP transporter TatT component family protein [Nitrospinales bacterium]
MIEKRCWFLFVVLVVLQGCSASQIALRLTLPLVDDQLDSLHEEEDPVLAERAIPAQMKMLEGFLKTDETNVHLLNLLAEGFCGYAFSFVEEKDRVRASALYLRGKGYARRALEKQAGGRHWMDQDLEEFQATLERLPRKSIPALFWLGQCWGRWLVLNLDNVAALADISKVEATLLRVLDMDPAFHHAGPHVALGSFYGSRTRLLGGKPERARRHFERSLKLTRNKFLLNQVLYAQTYAVQTQDRELFERLLNEVLQASSGILPRERLANEVAKIKAKKLLRSADDLF